MQNGIFQKIRTFFSIVWSIPTNDLPKLHALGVTFCRVVILTWRFFMRNRCTQHAASLTYYTLISIVPVMALLFAVAKGFNFDQMLKARLLAATHGNETVMLNLIEFADRAIQNTSGGLMATAGILVLIWSAINLLSSIEKSFNMIWGVRKNRSLGRKCSDYLTLLIIYPILMIVVAASSTMVFEYLCSWSVIENSTTWKPVASLAATSIHMLSVWFMFFFIYIFSPNTKVAIKAAVIPGVLVGTLYMLLQYAYVYAQTKLTGYNAIYGSFAALPFFLIWLNLGWILVVFGAQLSFAIQNVNIYELEPGGGELPVSVRYRWFCALRIVHAATNAFMGHKPPYTLMELARDLQIPVRTARYVINDLCAAGIMIQVKDSPDTYESYIIALPPDEITPLRVLRGMTEMGASGPLPAVTPDFESMIDSLWEYKPEPQLERTMGSIK